MQRGTKRSAFCTPSKNLKIAYNIKNVCLNVVMYSFFDYFIIIFNNQKKYNLIFRGGCCISFKKSLFFQISSAF